MKLAVLGASGRTGALVAHLARGRGHHVTGVVRTGNGRDHVADPLDPDSLAPAFAGADAVVSAIGPRSARKPTSVLVDSATSAIAAMRLAGVRRLLVVSSSATAESGDTPVVAALVKPLLRSVFRHAWADVSAMEPVVRASGLDWTLVRAPMLTNGPARGRYRVQEERSVLGGLSLSRTDLAAFLLDRVEDPESFGKALAVAY
ncbi:NAD(P)H-binding protein [Actinosynnema pretiosum subsp. pretiosum]|uniref:NAD(P)H-binding protein n=2 Tax=Actinosynnema TaxID=40566 RepID=A0AA45LCY6_9PSEU|nr:NAD(P)H-binding protein [Actinosynnema mirum]ACU35305.1 putative secreted protein [Actinosynnema mirum DSM 43827]QUF07000.1 NAD(P)H-binding protein [Actinosynnema pretiosum subsp. pretiosum]